MAEVDGLELAGVAELEPEPMAELELGSVAELDLEPVSESYFLKALPEYL